MTTDPKTLIERFPLTAEACELDANVSSLTFSALVRDYARKNRIGDSAFDSVESLMQAIESHLAAKRPKPLTEEDVRAMLWGRSGRDVTIGSEKLFTTPEESGIHDALIAINNHNAIVDRL